MSTATKTRKRKRAPRLTVKKKKKQKTEHAPVECKFCGWETCRAKGDETKCDRLVCPVPECKRKRFSHPKGAAYHLEIEHDNLTLCFRCEKACDPDKTCSTCRREPDIDVFSRFYNRCATCELNAPMCMGVRVEPTYVRMCDIFNAH